MSKDDGNWTTSDDAQFRFEVQPSNHPTSAARRFMDALQDDESTVGELQELVTPESLDAWDDFTAAADTVRSWADFGFRETATASGTSSRDVAYVPIHGGITDATILPSGSAPPVVAVVKMVWREELGGWRVHSVADVEEPGALPRTPFTHVPGYWTGTKQPNA